MTCIHAYIISDSFFQGLNKILPKLSLKAPTGKVDANGQAAEWHSKFVSIALLCGCSLCENQQIKVEDFQRIVHTGLVH